DTGVHDLVDDGQGHARRRGPDDGIDALTELAVDGLRRDVGRRVTRVAFTDLDRLAEHAARVVDVLDRETDTCSLGWAEEGEAARLGEQRADLQRAVAGPGPLDRDLRHIRLRRRLGRLEGGLGVVDLVARVELLDSVARNSGLAVAGELEGPGRAVVVD